MILKFIILWISKRKRDTKFDVWRGVQEMEERCVCVCMCTFEIRTVFSDLMRRVFTVESYQICGSTSSWLSHTVTWQTSFSLSFFFLFCCLVVVVVVKPFLLYFLLPNDIVSPLRTSDEYGKEMIFSNRWEFRFLKVTRDL